MPDPAISRLGALIRQLQGAMQGERRVRGTVGSTGVASTGSGFSVSKTGTGTYVVTFTTAFSGTPSIVPGNGGTSGIFGVKFSAVSANGFTGLTFNSTGASTDGEFSFVAIG